MHSQNPPDTGSSDTPRLLGWREWVAMPGLGLPAVKAKLDTGARTSALHAFDIESGTDEAGKRVVHFSTRPLQRNDTLVVRCCAELVDQRRVTDSGGHRADRYVVRTSLALGELSRTIELTLSDRADMLFRMLIGRTALLPDQAVVPSRSFTLGRMNARQAYANLPSPDGAHRANA